MHCKRTTLVISYTSNWWCENSMRLSSVRNVLSQSGNRSDCQHLQTVRRTSEASQHKIIGPDNPTCEVQLKNVRGQTKEGSSGSRKEARERKNSCSWRAWRATRQQNRPYPHVCINPLFLPSRNDLPAHQVLRVPHETTSTLSHASVSGMSVSMSKADGGRKEDGKRRRKEPRTEMWGKEYL